MGCYIQTDVTKETQSRVTYMSSKNNTIPLSISKNNNKQQQQQKQQQYPYRPMTLVSLWLVIAFYDLCPPSRRALTMATEKRRKLPTNGPMGGEAPAVWQYERTWLAAGSIAPSARWGGWPSHIGCITVWLLFMNLRACVCVCVWLPNSQRDSATVSTWCLTRPVLSRSNCHHTGVGGGV